jgi:hypothetical protein
MQMTKSEVRLKRMIARQERIDSGLKKTMAEVIEQGRDLCEQKAELKHGEWIPWVEENMPIGIDQAGKYMRIFKNQHELNSHSDTNLTIDTACQMLATPKPVVESPVAEEPVIVEPDDELDAEWEEVEEVDEVAVTRRKFDYGEMSATARRICSSTKSLYIRIVEFQAKCMQLNREGRDSISGSWNKKEWDDLFAEVEKMNKIFKKGQ